MKLCQKCNKINVDEAKTCRYCGEPFAAEVPFGFKIVDDLNDDSPSMNSLGKSIASKSPSTPPVAEKVSTAKSPASPPKFPVKEETPTSKLPTSSHVEKGVPTDKFPLSSSTICKEPIAKSLTPPVSNKAPITKQLKEHPAEDVKSIVTVHPVLTGKSVRYADKINSYDGFEKIKCPKCCSDNITLVSNTEKRGFKSSDACCGYMILGPLGLLCGSVGSNKTSTTEYWVCGSCGNHFQRNSGNAAKEKIKHQGMLLSNVPDTTIDNVDTLYSQSSSELEKIKAHYKVASREEYLHNNNLKIYAIISMAIAILAFILAVLLYFLFDAGITASAISLIVAVVMGVAALLLKPIFEKKFASQYFIQAQSDLKESIEINKQLKLIKEAKENLSKLRII